MKFQDDISNMNTHIHTDKPKPICPPLFQSWGHKEGGIYTEHRMISFSSVTETATAYKIVLSLISRWGKDELTRIELPPEVLRQSE